MSIYQEAADRWWGGCPLDAEDCAKCFCDLNVELGLAHETGNDAEIERLTRLKDEIRKERASQAQAV